LIFRSRPKNDENTPKEKTVQETKDDGLIDYLDVEDR